ncbi:MAG: DUF302 domain-containing protein [Chloroflexi bacterium]|jgi:uncharacterized protein (DUF302 family)|nr:DUF302 domain-containing protein [Chloroflexota bacterium]
MTDIGIKVPLDLDYDSVLEKVTEALKVEGFGVLTEIDVKATLKKKLDVDFRPYKILGACNPALAHRALLTAPDVGMLLPCNVTVAQEEDGRVSVSIIDPLAMMGLMVDPALDEIAQEANERLSRVAQALAES